MPPDTSILVSPFYEHLSKPESLASVTILCPHSPHVVSDKVLSCQSTSYRLPSSIHTLSHFHYYLDILDN